MAEPLKPCPFCGGNSGSLLAEAAYYKGSRFYVRCIGGCGSMTEMKTSEEEAIAAWNRRANDPMPTMLAIVRSMGGRVSVPKGYFLDFDGDLVLTRTEDREAYVFTVQATVRQRHPSGTENSEPRKGSR